MLDRLAGMETEYAIRFHPAHSEIGRVPNKLVFGQVLDYLRTKFPIVPSIVDEGMSPHAWFLANGGAVRFERILYFGFLPAVGLLEGMTPECRGPRQLIAHQRAQDVLLSQACANVRLGGTVALIKNNIDSRGNSYGNHENYEATVATGPMLRLWRLGIALLLPMLLAIALVSELAFLLGLGILFVAARLWAKRDQSDFRSSRIWDTAGPWIYDLVTWPARQIVTSFFRLTAFRTQRRRLLAFLVSRPIIIGAGHVDSQGRFYLSGRGLQVRRQCGAIMAAHSPIFLFNHAINNVFRLLLGDRWSFRRMFRERQRLQISSADSNMTQTAEYLKVGTMLLVLDAIEAGELDDAPRVRWPIRAIHAICRDPELKATVRLDRGRSWTALQIQRFYLEACRRTARRQHEADAEVQQILALWEEVLHGLERHPNELVGKLDWVTKRHLLEQAGGDASLDSRRKIDIKYHELTQAGYYIQLEAAGAVSLVVDPDEVRQAVTEPPLGTPAQRRGRLIRELAEGGQPVRASWSTVVVGNGRANARPIEIS
jgi:proteasome accessory factor A